MYCSGMTLVNVARKKDVRFLHHFFFFFVFCCFFLHFGSLPTLKQLDAEIRISCTNYVICGKG